MCTELDEVMLSRFSIKLRIYWFMFDQTLKELQFTDNKFKNYSWFREYRNQFFFCEIYLMKLWYPHEYQ